MSNRTFDILKYIQRIALPAIIAFLATILPLCGVSAETVTVITGILAALDTLMAALLQVSTTAYNNACASVAAMGELWNDKEEAK